MPRGRPYSSRISEGDVFESRNYGLFKIVRVESAKEIECMFIDTGTRVVTQAGHIDRGALKDPNKPHIFGVGFVGVGKHKPRDNKQAYQTWRNMLARCYCGKARKRYPTYSDCKVSADWLNYQKFAEWFEKESRGLNGKYHLDKDIGGGKLYSSGTCKLVSPQENAEASLAIKFKLLSPSGEVIEGFNLSRFARENGLSQAHLSSVINGVRNSHKGWTRA